MEYIPSYCAPAVHWGLPPATRLVGRKILMEQNIKRLTGPALYIFSLLGIHIHCMGILVNTFVPRGRQITLDKIMCLILKALGSQISIPFMY
jgi:hypothetical protein